MIKSITSPLEDRKCLEMSSLTEAKAKTEIKSEIKTEEQGDQVKSFHQKVGIKSEATTERAALMPVKTEVLNNKTSVDGVVVPVAKTNLKRSFCPETEPASAKRMKRKSSTPSSDIILTTYSLIWRDLSELQKKHFSMCRIFYSGFRKYVEY